MQVASPGQGEKPPLLPADAGHETLTPRQCNSRRFYWAASQPSPRSRKAPTSGPGPTAGVRAESGPPPLETGGIAAGAADGIASVETTSCVAPAAAAAVDIIGTTSIVDEANESDHPKCSEGQRQRQQQRPRASAAVDGSSSPRTEYPHMAVTKAAAPGLSNSTTSPRSSVVSFVLPTAEHLRVSNPDKCPFRRAVDPG